MVGGGLNFLTTSIKSCSLLLSTIVLNPFSPLYVHYLHILFFIFIFFHSFSIFALSCTDRDPIMWRFTFLLDFFLKEKVIGHVLMHEYLLSLGPLSNRCMNKTYITSFVKAKNCTQQKMDSLPSILAMASAIDWFKG